MIPLEPGTQNLYAESNNLMQVGSLVIVKYSIRKKLLHYLGVVKDVNADDYLIQFLKHSGGGGGASEEDKYMVTKNNIVGNIGRNC